MSEQTYPRTRLPQLSTIQRNHLPSPPITNTQVRANPPVYPTCWLGGNNLENREAATFLGWARKEKNKANKNTHTHTPGKTEGKQQTTYVDWPLIFLSHTAASKNPGKSRLQLIWLAPRFFRHVAKSKARASEDCNSPCFFFWTHGHKQNRVSEGCNCFEPCLSNPSKQRLQLLRGLS